MLPLRLFLPTSAPLRGVVTLTGLVLALCCFMSQITAQFPTAQVQYLSGEVPVSITQEVARCVPVLWSDVCGCAAVRLCAAEPLCLCACAYVRLCVRAYVRELG